MVHRVSAFPGGRVNHLAGEVAVAAGGIRLAAAGFASAGTLVAPSSAVRLRFEYRSLLVRCAAVSAWVTPGYVSPEGGISRDAAHNAASVRVGRTRGPYFAADSARRLGRAPLRDARQAPVRTELGVQAGVTERSLAPRMRLSAGTSGVWSQSTDDRGRNTERVQAEGSVAMRIRDGRARLSVSRTWLDGEVDRDRFEASGGLRGRVLSVDTRLVSTISGQQSEVTGKAEARARFGEVEIFGRIGTVDPVVFDELIAERSMDFGYTIGVVVTKRAVVTGYCRKACGITGPDPTLRPEALHVRD
jgi:hypothetical protein